MMRLLTRSTLREIAVNALLGAVLFTFVLFLERMRPLFELLVRASAPLPVVVHLFLLVLPAALIFTIPVGVLIGVLLTTSRMSGDAEITAMRAAGIPSRRVLPAVFLFACFGMILTAAASMWLSPYAMRQRYRVINQLAAAQLTAAIQPRVFEEQFPNTILYVGDVIPGTVVRWRNVFLADLTPPDQRRPGAHEQAGEGPRITVAAEALAAPDVERNRIQLSLTNGSTHVIGEKAVDYYGSSFPKMEQILQAARPAERRPRLPFIEMDSLTLFHAIGRAQGLERVEAVIEFHQRIALPFACLLLALVGVPLGVSSRKAGKSSGFVLTVLIAFLYYLTLITMTGLAREGRLPAALSVWLPNAVLAAVAAVALFRLERPGDRDLIGGVRGHIVGLYARLRGKIPGASGAAPAPALPTAFGILPQLVDRYVVSSFLYYFALLLASFVLMTHVFTFFDLLGDIVKNRIPMWLVFKYLLFLTPQLIYILTPISVLVAVLVTFGVLAKNNEITAMKACGVSVYRLAVPVLLASLVFSGLLFAFDYTYIPRANLIQDGIRAQIKGFPAQTYLRPDRKWIYGKGSRIYYYKYFDPSADVMLGVNVFELEPGTFRLTRYIAAEQARWEPSLKTWVFQNGSARWFNGGRDVRYHPFEGATATFRDLEEPPSYFLKEVKQDKQMNPPELAAYIAELRQSGFDTVRLQVQFHRKFAAPLFAVIMALISIPFAFLAGARGAIAGVGISFSVAVAYWIVNQIFEQVGNVSQLPPGLAAWAPGALFSLCGLYLLARMKT